MNYNEARPNSLFCTLRTMGYKIIVLNSSSYTRHCENLVEYEEDNINISEKFLEEFSISIYRSYYKADKLLLWLDPSSVYPRPKQLPLLPDGLRNKWRWMHYPACTAAPRSMPTIRSVVEADILH
jgi:hypothetical protein